jgi:spore coat protein U-like protein
VSKFYLIFFVAILVFPSEVKAQTCSASIAPVNFGSVNLISGAAFSTASTVNLSCQGLAGKTVRVCTSFGSGSGGTITGNPRTLSNGANLLDYNLYTDPGNSNIWGSFIWPFTTSYPGSRTLMTLPASGTISTVLNIYGKISANQTTRAAVSYSSNFSGGHALVSYDYNSTLPCQTPPSFSSATGFIVSANVPPACQVSASDLDFGSSGNFTTNIDAASAISVRCTNTSPFQIGISNGLTGTSPIARKMTLGASSITYGLFRDAGRTLPWGITLNSNTATGTGTGNTQNIPVYGRIPPQTAPTPGIYTDTLNVTVTY